MFQEQQKRALKEDSCAAEVSGSKRRVANFTHRPLYTPLTGGAVQKARVFWTGLNRKVKNLLLLPRVESRFFDHPTRSSNHNAD
jgi:hypothetical protein